MNNPPIRYINLGLVLAFSICYMEWGQGQSAFVFQGAYEVFAQSKNLLSSLTHPLILGGFAGVLILLYCATKAAPNKTLNMAGLLVLGPVVLLILLAGSLSMNWKSILSTLPFVGLSVWWFVWWWRSRKGGL